MSQQLLNLYVSVIYKIRSILPGLESTMFTRETGSDAGFGSFFCLRTTYDLVAVYINNYPRRGFTFSVLMVFLMFNAVRHIFLLSPTSHFHYSLADNNELYAIDFRDENVRNYEVIFNNIEFVKSILKSAGNINNTALFRESEL